MGYSADGKDPKRDMYTEPLSLQRQIDQLKMQIQSLMNRTGDLEEIRDRSKHAAKKSDHLMVETDLQNRRFDTLENKVDNLLKRVSGLEADRVAWAQEGVGTTFRDLHARIDELQKERRSWASERIDEIDERLDKAFQRIGNTASDVTKLIAPLDIKLDTWFDRMEEWKEDADFAINENSEYCENALDEMEKKLDAYRVALNNTEQITYEHTLRLHGIDNMIKDQEVRPITSSEGVEIGFGVMPPSPWKKRWDALRAYMEEKHRITGSIGRMEAFEHALKEMDALEKGI